MLQWVAADRSERPVLLHQERRVGHGAGERGAEQADVVAFVSSQLGIEP